MCELKCRHYLKHGRYQNNAMTHYCYACAHRFIAKMHMEHLIYDNYDVFCRSHKLSILSNSPQVGNGTKIETCVYERVYVQ